MSLSGTKQATANSIKTDWVAIYKRYRAAGNLTPEQSDELLDAQCQELADTMMSRIYDWINGS